MQLPLDFDPIKYKEYYKDLKNLNNEQLAKHYIEYGEREGRRYNDKLPECIKEVLITSTLKDNDTWSESYNSDERFCKEQLKINELSDRLMCKYKNNTHYILKTFLIFQNTNQNIVLFRVSKKYIFISDVTHYRNINAIYDIESKQLTIDNSKKTNHFIELVTIFTNLIKKHKDLYNKHLFNNKDIKLSTFIGVKQIMHHYVNELSGLYNLLFNNRCVHSVYCQFEYYCCYESLFNEVLNDTLIRRKISVEEIFLQTCKENLFFIKQCNDIVPSELNLKVINTALNNNITLQKKLKTFFAQKNKCFLFTVRNSHRKLINQVGFIVTCIRELNILYPNSIFLIDGSTKLIDTNLTESSSLIQKERETYLQICERLESVNLKHIKTYSLIFEPIDTFIQYAQYVDFYISHVGTLQHKLGYFSNANGVVHGGGESHHVATDKEGWYWGAHFGKKCTVLDTSLFNYVDIKNYISNYTADLKKVREWARSILL